MTTFNRIFPSALLIALGTAAAQAQQWTRFRGPNGSGISQAVFPAQWAPADFEWQVTLPGNGHSSPVIWQDKVFLTAADPQTAQRIVLCLNAKDGATLWRKEFESHTFKEHMDNSYASATPAVDADQVYVAWNTREELTLAALKHDGTVAWKTNLGAFVSQHGGGNSPIVVGDTVLLGDDQEEKGQSFLFGIDRDTGKVRWQSPRKTDKFSAATPAIFHTSSGEDQAIFCSKGDGMVAVDPRTGKRIWQLPDLFDSRTVASPAVGDGLIFATCGEGQKGHVLVAVRPANGSAAVAWKVRDETPYVPTPLVKDHLLYYWNDRGTVTCAQAATGQIVWQKPVPGDNDAGTPGGYFSSPVLAGGVLFNVTKQGEVTAIAAGDAFRVLGHTPLHEKCHATIAISGGRMFVRTLTHLYCVRSRGGQASAK